MVCVRSRKRACHTLRTKKLTAAPGTKKSVQTQVVNIQVVPKNSQCILRFDCLRIFYNTVQRLLGHSGKVDR
jgi:hypothetical protein